MTNTNNPMDVEVIRRICLARHLYELGAAHLKSDNDLYLFSAANLLQDAAEAFLLALADFLHAGIGPSTHFDKYFTLINEKVAPKELPFRNQLLRLNKIRVNSKHYGIQPERDECVRLSISLREFFEEVSLSIIGLNFSTVSMIDLLQDGEVKAILSQAKLQLEQGEIEECAISCRKAIFLELEKDYSIFPFREEVPKTILGGYPYSKAPFYAKSKDYIEKNVKDPIDYIVYDHSSLEQDLLKYGIDNTSFWNIWRLTPPVFRMNDNEWAVRYEFEKLDPDVLRDKIEYIFNTTVDIVFTVHSRLKYERFGESNLFAVELTQENVPVFDKADRTLKMIGKTPAGLNKIMVANRVTGLKGDGYYWRVLKFRTENKTLLFGFIHEDYTGAHYEVGPGEVESLL